MYLNRLLRSKGIVILDGALGTELENRGVDVNHPLWSAYSLAVDPQRVGEVHFDYLNKGSDIIITSSYQASISKYVESGILTTNRKHMNYS